MPRPPRPATVVMQKLSNKLDAKAKVVKAKKRRQKARKIADIKARLTNLG